MPDQSYLNLNAGSLAPEWKSRLRMCLMHTAVNVKIKAAPANEAEARADALGRQVVQNIDFWVEKFAPVVAVILIGQPNLTAAEVTDEELFPAVDVAWTKMYETP